MSELSKDAEDLLARARAVPPLARDRRIKVRAALIGQIALAPATGAAAGALGKLGLAKVLMVVSALGVAGTGALIASRNSGTRAERDEPAPVALRAPPPSSEHEPAAPPIAPSPREVPAPSVEEAAESDQIARPDPVKAESHAAAKKTAPSEPVSEAVAPASPTSKTDPDTLREEIDLVQKANTLLRNGKPEQARALLDRHGQKFASGALSEEREAARILALCALGKEREAQAAAAKFLRDSPRSMQAARVRASCATKESTNAR